MVSWEITPIINAARRLEPAFRDRAASTESAPDLKTRIFKMDLFTSIAGFSGTTESTFTLGTINGTRQIRDAIFLLWLLLVKVTQFL
jgi:hypothetical protein